MWQYVSLKSKETPTMQCFYIETTTQSMLSDTGTVIDYLIILINKDIYAFDCQSVVF